MAKTQPHQLPLEAPELPPASLPRKADPGKVNREVPFPSGHAVLKRRLAGAGVLLGPWGLALGGSCSGGCAFVGEA